jgi:hypothetical protein
LGEDAVVAESGVLFDSPAGEEGAVSVVPDESFSEDLFSEATLFLSDDDRLSVL